MRSLPLCLAVFPVVIVLTVDGRSFSSGSYTSATTRTTPSCGACHSVSPGGVTVGVTPAARSLARSSTTTVNVRVSGPAGNTGGFASDITLGTLIAGANTTVGSPGTSITHATNSARTWSFTFNAGTTPGLVELNTVAMASNGSASTGDSWAFFGVSAAATTGTPVRMYVNAVGVTPIGASCTGSFNNVPVLGARQTPSVGNAAFAIELHGAAPSQAARLYLGSSAFPMPFDLAPVGITGCHLFIAPILTLVGTTSVGNAQRSEGAATFSVPIPNTPSLRNGSVFFQAYFVDPQEATRALKLTFTNALRVTIQ